MESKLTYNQAVECLMQQLPMFSKQGQKALYPSLDNITALCEALGNPQRQFKSIHIAGTNGKGSTSHILAAVFQTAGYKTGLYTSPHLIDIRERSRINGKPISEQFLIDFIFENKALIDKIKPSYFELNVAMAFTAFAKEKVDIAIIETGLGGRWDSTNIIVPELSVITNISLDHTQILGKTIEKIATSKAGIIKENIPAVIGESQEAADSVFVKEAVLHHTTLRYADVLYNAVTIKKNANGQVLKIIDQSAKTMFELETDLIGSFQQQNIVTAFTAVKVMEELGWKVNQAIFIKALKNIKQLTGLKGRWDWIRASPNVILDVAHNPAGIKNIQEQLQHEDLKNTQKHIIIGFVADKDVAEALEKMPQDALYYYTQADVPRALDHQALAAIGTACGLKGKAYPTVKAALGAAFASATKEDTILITGSFFIVGSALEILEN